MKKYNILIGSLVGLAFLAVGGVWLHARQLPKAASVAMQTGQPAIHTKTVAPSPLNHQSVLAPLATPSPTLSIPTATPSTIVVNTPTTVTVTVSISPSPISNGVNLLRIGPTGTQPTILGVMHDDGKNGDSVAGDGIYTLQLPFNEPAAGQLQLEVSVAFSGQLKRLTSTILLMNVWSIFTDPQVNVTITYPLTLFPFSHVDGLGNPSVELRSSDKPLLLGSGAFPPGADASNFAANGYNITIARYPYSSTPFDITQWLATVAASSTVESVAPYSVGANPAFQVVFTGEVGTGEPIIVVPHNGLVYTISYDSTFDPDSPGGDCRSSSFYLEVQALQFLN